MNKLDITVVLPILNEEENIEMTVKELDDVMNKSGMSYEILGINTPDRDKTYDVIEKLGEKYNHFYPINMKYRGGKRKLQKGYQYLLGFILGRGDIIVHMDSDYEDDPRDITKLVEKIKEGYDLVVGWRVNRKHTPFYRFTSKVYNGITSTITGVKIHDKNCGIKAYTREAAQALSLHGQNFRGIPVLLKAKGYRITEVPVNNRDRLGGKGNWNFMNRFLAGIFDLPSNILISKSGDMPFRFWGLWGYISLFTSLLSFMLYCYFVWGTDITFEKSILALNFSVLTAIIGVLNILTGLIMEYILDKREIGVNDYVILNDPKGRVK